MDFDTMPDFIQIINIKRVVIDHWCLCCQQRYEGLPHFCKMTSWHHKILKLLKFQMAPLALSFNRFSQTLLFPTMYNLWGSMMIYLWIATFVSPKRPGRSQRCLYRHQWTKLFFFINFSLYGRWVILWIFFSFSFKFTKIVYSANIMNEILLNIFNFYLPRMR